MPPGRARNRRTFSPGRRKRIFEMYLHLGRDIVVMQQEIVGVFDLDTSTWSRRTKSFLTACEKAGKVINVSDDLPKSAVVCCGKDGRTVGYISQLSSQTLLRRSRMPLA